MDTNYVQIIEKKLNTSTFPNKNNPELLTLRR